MSPNTSHKASGPSATLAIDLRDPTARIPESGAHIVLLGTQGGPIPGARAATSSALVVDGDIYIIDAGSGLPIRFSEAKLNFKRVRAMFITHLHSDHYADYFNFLQLNWTNWDPESNPIELYGPGSAAHCYHQGKEVPGLPDASDTPVVAPESPTPSISEMDSLFIRANAYDLNERLRSTRRRDNKGLDFTGIRDTPMYRVHDISLPPGVIADSPTPACKPFEIYKDDKVKVLATLVDHPPVYPSFAFRFETEYGSVAWSGDTRPCQNLIDLSKNASVLVNEVMDIDAAIDRFAGTPIYSTMARQFLSAHTPMSTRPPSDDMPGVPGVGVVARDAGVSALVLNHIYPGDGSVPDETFHKSASLEFNGPVVVGRDLMLIDLAIAGS